MKFNPVKFNWLVLCVLIVIAAIAAYYVYQTRDKQHPCYDPDFVPVIPELITLPEDLDLEPITVDNVTRIVQLDADIAIDEFLYVLNEWSLVAKPTINDTSGIFADASLTSRSAPYGTEGDPFILEGDRLGPISLADGGRSIGDITFTPNGQCIVFGGREAIRFWRFAADAEIAEFSTEGFLDKLLSLPTRATIATIDFDDKGRFLAYGNHGDNDSGGAARAGVWDLARSKEILHFTTTNAAQNVTVSHVAISGDGQYMVAAESNGIITIWDIQRESQVMVIEGYEVTHRVVFDKTGQLLVARTNDGVIRFWDAASGELIIGLDVSQSTDMAFSPDMRLLVTIDFEGVVRYWGVPVAA